MLLGLNNLKGTSSEEPRKVQGDSDLSESPEWTDDHDQGLHLN